MTKNPFEGYTLSNKRILIKYTVLLFVVLLVVAALWMIVSNYLSYKDVTLMPTRGTTITLGTSKTDEPSVDSVVFKTNTISKERIRKGDYYVKYSGDGYQDLVNPVTIDKNVEIKTPDLDYSKDKLNQLLTTEKALLHGLIISKLNNPNYSYKHEKLHKQGQWYSAVMRPTNPNQDYALIVAKKENNTWDIVAGPVIILSIDEHKAVPEKIIRDTNNNAYVNPD